MVGVRLNHVKHPKHSGYVGVAMADQHSGSRDMPFRIKSILVASDLSEGSRELLRTAGTFASLTRADLHVVHAVEKTTAGEGADEAAGQRLEKHVRAAVPATVGVTTSHTTAGRAHEAILGRALVVQADLIVIGPHRSRAQSPAVLGTTADRLVRTSDVPLLIVRGPMSLPLRGILVPSDLSDAAEGALDLALIWAAALRLPSGTGDRTWVEVLHVLPSPALQTDVRRALQQQVAAAGERTGCASLLDVSAEVVEGDSAAAEILDRVRARGSDLLVLGTHGESALARALIGSVSSAVARRAECPVLLVPPAFWRMRQAREGALRLEG